MSHRTSGEMFLPGFLVVSSLGSISGLPALEPAHQLFAFPSEYPVFALDPNCSACPHLDRGGIGWQDERIGWPTTRPSSVSTRRGHIHADAHNPNDPQGSLAAQNQTGDSRPHARSH